jgi:hypothetical protein
MTNLADKQKNGRPTKYTKVLGEKICELLATTSMGLTTICRQADMPNVSTIHRWLNKDKEFCDTYTHAREAQADYLADEIIEIADETENDHTTIDIGDGVEIQKVNTEAIQRSKLRVEARKWKASKLAPKKYGEKMDVTSGGEKITTPSITGIDINRTGETTGSK